ncbi:MAG: CaiB/BaiF CoA transferase family protein [Rhodopirellula sp. JB044]|uniref:CaiB/BaiF CoA transferase family protein n=1 Tax=Rhodopirellula sp. JB044 TaxID=3342844 RepID=UPI003709E083
MVKHDEQPLAGITVLDFSQFLSGPSATLRLADLGARVIKIERPDCGDICRRHYVSNTQIDGESTLFHAINRNKESFCADLKNDNDLQSVRKLIARADVVVQNFRPGVMQRIGLDYDSVKAIKPDIVYAAITGYGDSGPWVNKAGQDLLVQALSGLTFLSGNAADGPVPMGLAIADIFAGSHLTQGILACLVRKGITGEGGLVEVSMLESILDFQFEPLTVYFQDGGCEAERTASNNAHAFLGAPYGIYATADGFIALAMASIPQLGRLLGLETLSKFETPDSWFHRRDEIKSQLAEHLQRGPTSHWLSLLEPADVWCADVLDWHRLREQEGYRVLGMEQSVQRDSGLSYATTRCPIRLNGERLYYEKGSPTVGQHNQAIMKEFSL